jgi:hypothetical protein
MNLWEDALFFYFGTVIGLLIGYFPFILEDIKEVLFKKVKRR